MKTQPNTEPDSPEEDKRVLTPLEVAQFLTVPVKTLYAWRSRSEGPPAFKVGRHLRYLLADVSLWVDARRDEDPRRQS